MWGSISMLSLLLLLFYGALKVKMRTYQISGSGENLPSPASRALAELVGIAGGIYLSLVMMVSFLKLTVPESISFGGWSLDPLALVAILVALIQPLILAWWPRHRKR
ncbi:hypothetical protein SAMN00808754_1289 [Thermanaeromonas toyohensis ToBE]|uniref:Uncharacterized protein n=1 Tax=Thermanaeromonas toyohensis ToBE TaxID=698762 RepID=A0A1W1VR88_9FIRM|nr:hypothetical protein [Thermanaeromonas toyohensis]SMB95611.1 hypothetical protein SAMN00808754_1289 [Thermanaeromonas toyohensis ToBE]